MKIIFKFFLTLFFLLLILITYLSIFGVETDKFNSQILNKIKKIDDKIELDLKKIDGLYQVIFWDGYSQSEIVEALTEKDAAKTLKRFMKKLAKNIN